MALVINHNMMAMTAARNFTRSYDALSKSTNRLSSGMRINSSADDAAGLAVSEFMRSEIAALGQGVRNAADAQSMLQTADGALQIIDEKLIRMKELAEQAATGTYNSVQRGIMNNEFGTMRSEINRIAEATKFNGVQLLNGTITQYSNSASGLKIHFGPTNSAAQDYYYVNIKSATGTALSIQTLGIGSQDGAQRALSALDLAITSKDTVRADIGSYINRLSNTVSQLSIQIENLQAAESRVRDVDVATEMTNFVNNQIKSQAAIAMLAQANTIPQMALTLIGG
ncbi:MAG: flagellin [Pseudomonadota bacterium]